MLAFDPQDTNFPWTFQYFLSLDVAPPPLSPAQTADCADALKRFKAEVPDLKNSEAEHLGRLCMALHDQRCDLVFLLFLGLNHLRLPAALRQQREARIATLLDGYFSGHAIPPEMVAGIDHIKLIAPLAPDAFLDGMVCSQATKLQMMSMKYPAWETCCTENLSDLNVLTAALGVTSGSAQDRLLVISLFSRPWRERNAFLNLLEYAVRSKLSDAVNKTDAALRQANLMLAFEGDVLMKVFQDCQAANVNGSGEADIAAAVANQVALGRTSELARLQDALTVAIDATRRRVPLGSKVNTMNQAAVAAANQSFWRQLLSMTPERLRRQRQQDRASVVVAGNTPTAPPDLDPVHAWSVGRLLRWIEGPILEPAPAPLERKKFVLKEKAARQEARVSTKMPDKAVRADQDLTEPDIDLAVQNALSTTAEFFIGDIGDMLSRAQALGTPSSAMQGGLDLLAPLKKLRSDDRSDDQKARALLHRASQAVDLLRRDIRAREFDVRVRQRFGEQLQAALYSEPMVEGKRHGGVIRCPLARSDWPWAAEQYHRRWLPWARQITVDGVPRILGTDEALGLYVTGKSLSGYEFDVSVHLWLRKPGCMRAPGASPSPFSPMNTEDWIDTLIPFAVLHVPSAT